MSFSRLSRGCAALVWNFGSAVIFGGLAQEQDRTNRHAAPAPGVWARMAERLRSWTRRFSIRDQRQQVLEDIKFLLCVVIALLVLTLFLVTVHW